MRLARLIRNLRQRERVDKELDDELRSFVEMSADERRRAGMGEDEARRAALLELGGAEQVKEGVRDVRAGVILDQLARDLSYAVRTLRRSPGFTSVALLSLALGIGANTAIFSLVDAVYWRPLPVSHPEQLVRIGLTDTLDAEGRQRVGGLMPFRFAGLHDPLAAVFAGVITRTRDGVSLTVDGVTERIVPDAVSPNYFAVLGVPAAHGRTFSTGGWAPEVVLNHRFWRSRFGGDPGAIGRTVLLNGYPFTIVGVATPAFFGTEVGAFIELWVMELPPALEHTLPALPQLQRGRWFGSTLARLRPGVSLAQAQGVAEAAYQNAVREHFGAGSPYRATHVRLSPAVRGGDSGLRGAYERPLIVLATVVGLVLLVACANVASLLLGRATARRQELAVRLALGGGRARLVRQLLTETLLLSSLGSVLGVLLAYRSVDALLGFLPQTYLRTVLDVEPDLRVLGFAVGLSVLTALLSGLAPAFQGTRVDLTAVLKGGSPAGQPRVMRLRQGLVVGEVALALLLMVGATLFARTLRNLQAVDTGFDADGLVLFTFKHVHERYTEAQVLGFCRELVERVRGLPGVVDAGLSLEGGPFDSRSGHPPVATSGPSAAGPGIRVASVDRDRVSPGFFSTLGIPLLAGRDFSLGDQKGTPKVAIVDETLRRRLFGEANPVGQRIVIGDNPAEETEIVGVVRTIHQHSFRAEDHPAVYLSIFQAGKPRMPTLLVRARGSTAALVPAVRREFEALDATLPVFNIKTMERQLDDVLSRERLLAALCGLLGTLAAFLAAIGLYAIIAHAALGRTREIGIRLALGARPGGVAWLVMREALQLVTLGVGIGLAATWGSTRLLSSLLFGLTPVDPASLMIAVALMLVVAILASYVPARRASRLDPTRALRYE